MQVNATATKIIQDLLNKNQVVMDVNQLKLVREAMRIAVFQMYIDTSLAYTPEAKSVLREYNKYIYQKSQLLGLGVESQINIYGKN